MSSDSNRINRARLDYLEAQQRLMARHIETNSPLNLDDVEDLEVLLISDLGKVGYDLKELEKLHISNGRIYGRASVISKGRNEDGITHYSVAVIDFHTNYGYSVVIDSHEIGGDEWSAQANNVIYQLSYSSTKQGLYLNGVKIYQTRTGNADIVLRDTFKSNGSVKECADFKDKFGHNRGDHNFSIDTKLTISNIKNRSNLPSCLNFIFTSFDNGKGIKIITEITQKDIAENNIDTELVDSWLASR